MDTSEYLGAFLAETEDNLSTLNELCLALEQQGADDNTFAAMFRAAHTLKGMSATMGYAKMADLTHHMEDTLGYVRQHPDVFRSEVVDVFFQAIDGLTNNLEVLREQGDETGIDHSAVIKELAKILNEEPEATNTVTESGTLDANVMNMLQQLERGGSLVGVLKVDLEPSCVMKGVRMVMVMRALDNYADCLGSSPDAPILEEGDFDGSVLLAIVLRTGTFDDVQQAVADITEVKQVTFIDWKQLSSPNQEVASTGETVAEKGASAESKPVDSVQAQDQAKTGSTQASTQRNREQTLRVPVNRIDDFMNILSELVIAKTRLEMLAKDADNTALRDVSEQIGRLSESLQDGVMSMRMMPVESLFQRFPRMMRDIQKRLDREFDFQMTGLETEMDRTVMDEMGEALVHLLRNAADHGLESPAEREQAGKPRRGTIRLSAFASGGHVHLEVADDGGGIHRDRVLQSAIKKGVVDPARAQTMSDAQVHELLFASGFSTAATVSDISGRGVGLDAVRGKVEALGGIIRIESTVGQGTTFIIELPLTLTILQAMLVQVGEELFALPTSGVEEVARLTREHIDWVHERPVLKYRDKVIPIVDLGDQFFSHSAQKDYPWNAVICREGQRWLALTVDDVVDELEVVNKPLGKYLEGNKMFTGATILGDGHVALIVDVHQFFQDRH
ncbi:chemotaxis protein CheA [Alicyclobacillus dauci]|uniref:Chemotaxis protein CheA n=1 Tax=Alicyclobacillus dauci TaxID=1475485 RepID=A0ABY6YXP3_9BACL|nr:chemotaxis protein CheA [Alicyclobacillus dauci]WAH35385.1 chemotaxis protein CheA [Alicyclobacillus dauci]